MERLDKDIDIIMRYDVRKVLREMLVELSNINNNTFTTNLRQKLCKQWYDGMWWPEPKIKDIIPRLFTFRHTSQRHFNGGSWAPECDYMVNVSTCNLCGDIIEISEDDNQDTGFTKHLETCDVTLKIMDKCNSLHEFRIALLQNMK